VREDGKKEEVLQGNYSPFGPSLALAGVGVVFYDPLLRAVAAWWLFRPARLPGLPFHLIGIS
jgi:prepilin signal peptidase PulO-like enzyme (type II secretory pathway)